MKSLQTIQKVSKVFKTLSMIAMIASFLWAATSLIGLICVVAWETQGILGFGRVVMFALDTESLSTAIAALLSDAVFAVTDGVLFLFAWRYFKAELTEGTPFTQNGAVKVRHLGISTIVMPIVAVIVSAVIYAVYAVEPMPDWSTGASTLLGVVLILASLVFRYGADLEKGGAKICEVE